MKYRIATRKHGFIVQQSEEGKNIWRTAEKTGFYRQRSSAGSRLRQLRQEQIGNSDSMAHRIMSSPRFCKVGM